MEQTCCANTLSLRCELSKIDFTLVSLSLYFGTIFSTISTFQPHLLVYDDGLMYKLQYGIVIRVSQSENVTTMDIYCILLCRVNLECCENSLDEHIPSKIFHDARVTNFGLVIFLFQLYSSMVEKFCISQPKVAKGDVGPRSIHINC